MSRLDYWRKYKLSMRLINRHFPGSDWSYLHDWLTEQIEAEVQALTPIDWSDIQSLFSADSDKDYSERLQDYKIVISQIQINALGVLLDAMQREGSEEKQKLAYVEGALSLEKGAYNSYCHSRDRIKRTATRKKRRVKR